MRVAMGKGFRPRARLPARAKERGENTNLKVRDSRNRERELEVTASKPNGAARLDLKLDSGRTAHFILGEKEVKRMVKEIAEAI